ncbi:hypothetical protein BDR03DRAFT_1009588 [Suillus americanus]|nr:hypothetical protein BDR03DRAFT_1009588 [Suillus americanus]
MSTFDFSNIVNPEAERIQRVFAELHLRLVNLANTTPEDRPDLMAHKEEWGHDWTWLMQDLSQCLLKGKTYNLGLALTTEESDMGRRSDELHQRYQEEARREAEKDKGKEKESAPGEEDEAMDGEDADGEAEEAEPPKRPARPAARTTKAGSEG